MEATWGDRKSQAWKQKEYAKHTPKRISHSILVKNKKKTPKQILYSVSAFYETDSRIRFSKKKKKRIVCSVSAFCSVSVKKKGCLLRKKKSFTQLGQRFFRWGWGNLIPFIALLRCILGVQRVYGFGVHRVCGKKRES